VIEFIDDIFMYSKNVEEHAHHLKKVLILLRENPLYVKLKKCFFFQYQIHYLWHVVSKEAMSVDPKKIKSIME